MLSIAVERLKKYPVAGFDSSSLVILLQQLGLEYEELKGFIEAKQVEIRAELRRRELEAALPEGDTSSGQEVGERS